MPWDLRIIRSWRKVGCLSHLVICTGIVTHWIVFKRIDLLSFYCRQACFYIRAEENWVCMNKPFDYMVCKIPLFLLMQNAAEKPPFFLPSWTAMYLINAFIVVWVLVVGFGFGGWASMTNFIRQINTFGLFAKCYQCAKPPPAPQHH